MNYTIAVELHEALLSKSGGFLLQTDCGGVLNEPIGRVIMIWGLKPLEVMIKVQDTIINVCQMVI